MSDIPLVRLKEWLVSEPEYGANESAIPYDGRNPRYLRITDISDNGNLICEDRVSIPLNRAKPYILNPNDIVIARTGNTVGKAYIYRVEDGSLAFAGYLIRFRFNENLADPMFVFHYLHSPGYYKWVAGTLRTGAQPNINATEYCELPIPDFNIKEQHKITRILTTVDTLIEKTEALIRKYEFIKQGMMNDLFTRGVDETGRLRPTYEEAPYLYWESELGWIPKGWEVVSLENLLSDVHHAMRSGPFGSVLKKDELVDQGIPFLGIDNVFPEKFVKDYKRFVTPEKYQELSHYSIRDRDVMITIMGTVGRSCVVPLGTGQALSSKHVWTMTFNENRYLPELICLQLNYAPWVLTQFRREEQGAVMSAIRSSVLRNLKFPSPPIKEQNQIYNRIASVNSKIRLEKTLVNKANLIKNGLMQDILTGKVRVKSEEN